MENDTEEERLADQQKQVAHLKIKEQQYIPTIVMAHAMATYIVDIKLNGWNQFKKPRWQSTACFFYFFISRMKIMGINGNASFMNKELKYPLFYVQNSKH